MSKKGIGKFIAGAAVGAGLGLLFAPKKGKEMRADIKKKFDEIIEQVKSLDKDEVKAEFDKKIKEIKKELSELDKEKVLKIAKKKGAEIKQKAEELVDLAIAKGTPILKKTAEELRDKAVDITKDVVKKLEAIEIK
ncbi:MAG: hypothetical protein HFJ12_02795 [Bacilli bacterium]|nr:hypothetical protein [Bacilli bacterium]